MSEDDIDPDISRWILDFLLRQPIQDHILESLVAALPISNKDFTLTKLFLLHKLQSEVSNCSISEKVLSFLEQIYEVDQCLGCKDCPESLQNAYCAVCVEFTIGFLMKSNNDVKGWYFDVVKRLWRGRVREMERKKVGLVSRELLEWRDDIEAAVWEESICLKVVDRSKDVDAVELVKLYVMEEKTRMGPPFLELVLKMSKKEEGAVSRAICSLKRGESDRLRRNDVQDQEFDNNYTCDKGEMVLEDIAKRNSLGRCKHVAHKTSRISSSGPSYGAKVVDVEDDSNAGKSCNEQVGTLEVEKVHKALESSRLGVPAIVEDPLSEALPQAESVVCISVAAKKNLEPPGDQNLELPGGQNKGKTPDDNVKNLRSNEPGEEDKVNVGVENMDFESPGKENRAKSSGVDNAVNVQSGEAKQNCPGQSSAPKNLMERKKTACTFEWDDSIDGSSVEPSDSSESPKRHGSRRRRVSPLNIYKEPKVNPPRKRRTWSNVEEDTLRAGVKKFGHGQWKCILNSYHDIFQGRTVVDLKDKWRNMIR